MGADAVRVRKLRAGIVMKRPHQIGAQLPPPVSEHRSLAFLGFSTIPFQRPLLCCPLVAGAHAVIVSAVAHPAEAGIRESEAETLPPPTFGRSLRLIHFLPFISSFNLHLSCSRHRRSTAHAVVSAVAEPVRPVGSLASWVDCLPAALPAGLLFRRGEEEWNAALTDGSRHHCYRCHLSGEFLFSPTLASTLYLALCFALQQRHGELAVQLRGVSELATPEEKQLYKALLHAMASDFAADATACRLQLSMAMRPYGAAMACPWDNSLASQLEDYALRRASISVECCLSLEQEAELHRLEPPADGGARLRSTVLFGSGGGGDMMSRVLDTGDGGMRASWESEGWGAGVGGFDALRDDGAASVIGQLGKIGGIKDGLIYSRPERTMIGADAVRWLDDAMGGARKVQFLLLYELFTGTVTLKLHANDDASCLPALLSRLMLGAGVTKGVLSSVLRVLDLNPAERERMPKYDEILDMLTKEEGEAKDTRGIIGKIGHALVGHARASAFDSGKIPPHDHVGWVSLPLVNDERCVERGTANGAFVLPLGDVSTTVVHTLKPAGSKHSLTDLCHVRRSTKAAETVKPEALKNTDVATLDALEKKLQQQLDKDIVDSAKARDAAEKVANPEQAVCILRRMARVEPVLTASRLVKMFMATTGDAAVRRFHPDSIDTRKVILIRKFMERATKKSDFGFGGIQAMVHQAIMGMGKTTVLGPLLALFLADGDRLVTSVMPRALVDMTRASIICTECDIGKLTRGVKDARALKDKLCAATKNRSLIVSNPTSLKSVLLKLLEINYVAEKNTRQSNAEGQQVEDKGMFARAWHGVKRATVGVETQVWGEAEVKALNDQSTELSAILSMLQHGVMLMDEVDLLLHPLKSELNWPLGFKEKLDLTTEPVEGRTKEETGLRYQLPWILIDAVHGSVEGGKLTHFADRSEAVLAASDGNLVGGFVAGSVWGHP
eukprot:gene316-biopygen71948